jgi:hypothetical protein
MSKKELETKRRKAVPTSASAHAATSDCRTARVNCRVKPRDNQTKLGQTPYITSERLFSNVAAADIMRVSDFGCDDAIN